MTKGIIKHRRECDTFIREYPGHAPDVFCDALIQYCNDLREGKMRTEMGLHNGGPSEDNRKDFYFFMTEGTLPNLRNTLLREWVKLGSSQYIEEFQHLGTFDYFLGTAKVQMTLPGEGFHHWHYDNAGYSNMSRWFVFITYLNDDYEGGETEFLNQGIRVKPEKGKTVIFPASYTHRHTVVILLSMVQSILLQRGLIYYHEMIHQMLLVMQMKLCNHQSRQLDI